MTRNELAHAVRIAEEAYAEVKTENEAYNARVADALKAIDAAREVYSALRSECEDRNAKAWEVHFGLSGAKRELSIYDGNAIARDYPNGMESTAIFACIRYAVRGKYADEWAEKIIETLEVDQGIGGLTRDNLALVRLVINGKSMPLSTKATERVWDRLCQECPRRGEDALGTPYEIVV